MDDQIPVIILLVVIFGVVIVVSYSRRLSWSQTMLENWAQSNGFKLVSAEYRWLPGPFFFRKSKVQTVYRIEVLDEKGERFSGWARCGGWFAGLYSNTVKVQWDQPVSAKGPPGFPVIIKPQDNEPHT